MRGLHNLNQQFLYRALRTDENPHQDIVSKAPHINRPINDHVRDGLKNPSNYISTTTSFDSAKKWINTSARESNYQRGTTIVKIDVSLIKSGYPDLCDSAYNFTDTSVRDRFLGDPSCDYARAYKEVVFSGRIPSQTICDTHVDGRGWIEISRQHNQLSLTSAPPILNSTTLFPNVTHRVNDSILAQPQTFQDYLPKSNNLRLRIIKSSYPSLHLQSKPATNRIRVEKVSVQVNCLLYTFLSSTLFYELRKFRQQTRIFYYLYITIFHGSMI